MDIHKLSAVLLILSFIGGCATTNHNYFQTGCPSDVEGGETSASLCIGSAVDYEITDETGKPPKITLGDEITLAPLLMLQYQAGATERIDGGFALGASLFSFNLRVFSKLCLFTKESRFGIALVPAFNLSFTPDSLWGADLNSATNVNFYLSLPVSYKFGDRMSLVFRPAFGREYTRISVKDDDDPEKNHTKSKYFNGRGLSAGLKIIYKKPDKFIFPEVSFITYDRGTHYIPFIGIAINP